MTSLSPRSEQARRQARGTDGRFTATPLSPVADNMPSPKTPTALPTKIGVLRVVLKGNRDVIGQVEKQSAMDALLSFLEVTAGAEVKRGRNCWVVAMPDVVGDTARLKETILREGNIVGVASDPEHAQALGRRLAERYDPERDGVAGHGVLDWYIEKFYMHGDGWDVYGNDEES